MMKKDFISFAMDNLCANNCNDTSFGERMLFVGVLHNKNDVTYLPENINIDTFPCFLSLIVRNNPAFTEFYSFFTITV